MGRPLRRLSFWGRPLWVLALVLGMGALVAGCGRGTFIGRQYDDFMAYYNTFHNAKQAFEKGLKSVTQSGSEIDRDQYLSVFPDPQAGSGESSFDKAIQKCADLLRNHPNSEWVDDALLLIGRSRYYQQNYAGAAQKFREVIALEGEREGEARFWLARTLVAAEQYAGAAEALRNGLGQEEDYGTWTARMRLVRGELFVRQEKWAEAEKALSRGLEGSLPEKRGARAAFLLGQVRETRGDLKGAQRAYRRVLDYDPRYELEFVARLGALEMQGRSGAPEVALDRLESLEHGDNTNEMRGKIARVRARLYREQGRPDKAKEILKTVLRGENAPRGAVQGRIHYDLATLYRDTYEKFTQAAAHFDTAATSLPSRSGRSESRSGRSGQMLPTAPTDAADQAERYRGLANRSQAVARMDSLLRLGRMPSSEFQEIVQRVRQRRLKRREREAQRRRRQQFRGGTRRSTRRGQSSQSQQSAVQTRESDAGFLFHRDPTLVQQGRRQFEQTWGDRPLVDNWRRVNAIQGSSTAATATEEQGPEQSGAQERSERLVDLSAVPRDSASQAEMEKERAVARYRLADALFRDAGRPDSAETWFRLVVKENKGHSVARKALYGLAQAHRAQGDTAAAQRAYRRIIENYPDTPYAERARQQLGLERAEPVSNRRASRADSAYAQAYDAWQQGALDAALGKFFAVAKTYPETSTAPRALLAAGVVYHRAARRDTSGRLRSRFERYVGSLAQSSSLRGPEAEADTVRDVQETAPAPEGRPSDTTGVSDAPQRAANTTAGPDAPKRVPPQSGRSSDTTTADPTPPRQAGPDTAAREKDDPQAPPRRRIDSTIADARDRPPQRPDSATVRTPALSQDSTVRPRQESSSGRAKTPQGNAPDSLRPRPDSAQVEPDSVQAGRPTQTRPTSPLEILLSYLTEQYSGTPEAKRAQALLAHLQQRAAMDSSARDSARSRTSSQVEGSPDSTTASGAASRSTTSPDSVARPRRRSPDSTRTDTIRSGEGGARPMRQ